MEEPRSLARLDGTPAVLLEVRKQAGTNTLDVIRRVKERAARLRSTSPPDFQITHAGDQSIFIEESFKAVQEHLILGGFCAGLVVLLVSFTLTPMLCSRLLKVGGKASTKETLLFRTLAGPYRRMLRWSMTHRWAVVALAVLIALSAGPLFMRLGKDFLPVDDRSEFEVTVRMPVGSSLEGSDAVMRQLEEELRQLPGVKNLLTMIGSDARALERLYVPSRGLGNVPVSNMVWAEEGSGPTQIDRVNRQRQIMITANLVEG